MAAAFLLVTYSTERKIHKTARAFGTAAIRNPSRALPCALKRIVAEFVYYDWERLLNVFQETAESRKFRVYVRRCSRAGALVPRNGMEWKADPIEVDRHGNIVSIFLHDQQFTDSAIGDLSKLPSTLKTLYLGRNNLTKLTVVALPRGLERLHLGWNQMTHLDLTKLPKELIYLFLRKNKLSSVVLSGLPQRLATLNLVNNELVSANLSALPPSLRVIALNENYLNDADFDSIPLDGRETEVLGRVSQRTRFD